MNDYRQAPHGYRRYLCANCGSPIDIPIHCSDKTCDVCTSVRRWKIRERIFYALQGLPVTQTRRWRHIVLTLKNTPDLADRLDTLIHSFRKLRHRNIWKRTQIGGFYTIEITEGVSGWHPHLHIVSYGYFIPLRQLSYVWRKITKDSHHVFLRVIRDGTNIAYYVSKYITKASTLSSQSTAQLNLVCRNRRLFGPFGKAAELMKRFKPPAKFAICVKCGSSDWIPEFLLDIWNRRLSRPG